MNGACSLAHKPVSRQPCTGMHRDCDLTGSNGDRQKKGAGAGATDAKKGDEPPQAPSGWLKIDSAVGQPRFPSAPPETKSSEVENKLEDEFVEEDVDIEAEVKKSFAAVPSASPEITNLAQIPSEPT